MTEYVYRVVDSSGNPLLTRKAGNNNKRGTRTAYHDGAVAARVASMKNNVLGYEEYHVQASAVEWHDYDVVTMEIAS